MRNDLSQAGRCPAPQHNPNGPACPVYVCRHTRWWLEEHPSLGLCSGHRFGYPLSECGNGSLVVPDLQRALWAERQRHPVAPDFNVPPHEPGAVLDLTTNAALFLMPTSAHCHEAPTVLVHLRQR